MRAHSRGAAIPHQVSNPDRRISFPIGSGTAAPGGPATESRFASPHTLSPISKLGAAMAQPSPRGPTAASPQRPLPINPFSPPRRQDPAAARGWDGTARDEHPGSPAPPLRSGTAHARSPQKMDKRKRRCLSGSQNILDVAQPADNNNGRAGLIPAESPGGGGKGRAGGGRLRGRCRPCRWPLRRAASLSAVLCRAVPRRPACRVLSAGRGGGGGGSAPRRPAPA